jgi:hypothetical protein
VGPDALVLVFTWQALCPAFFLLPLRMTLMHIAGSLPPFTMALVGFCKSQGVDLEPRLVCSLLLGALQPLLLHVRGHTIFGGDVWGPHRLIQRVHRQGCQHAQGAGMLKVHVCLCQHDEVPLQRAVFACPVGGLILACLLALWLTSLRWIGDAQVGLQARATAIMPAAAAPAMWG